ncbi:MAG: hypothetical protein Kilf2KO_22500 [Rhodospirillales bacterium]
MQTTSDFAGQQSPKLTGKHLEFDNDAKARQAIKRDMPYWPYWLIRGKLYDLQPWLEKHPGGAEFLLRCKGTDCTAAFEVHHLRMPKAEAMLKCFEVQTETSIKASDLPQFDWHKYGELRTRIAARLKNAGWYPGPNKQSVAVAVLAVIVNLTIPFVWSVAGYWCLLLALAYAMNMIILTGFGHMFLHMNTRLEHLGDLGGFSSYNWKSEHCLKHHIFTNHPDLDPDVTKFSPALHFTPGMHKKWQVVAPLYLFPLYAISFMLIRLMRPIEIHKDPTNWLSRTLWYVVGSFGWLALWYATGNFWVGLALECLASFFFLSLTLSNHNHKSCYFTHQSQDFVKHQMDACYDFGSINYWYSMISSAFLGSQTLHHLFPTLDPRYFYIVKEELENIGYPYRRRPFWQTYWDHIRFISGKA